MTPREWFVVCAGLGLLAGCAQSPPKIGRHLSGPWAQASQTFDERVKNLYPPGSPESTLIAELTREGFAIRHDQPVAVGFESTAVFDKPGFPCRLLWSVKWSADASTITQIAASYSGTCV